MLLSQMRQYKNIYPRIKSENGFIFDISSILYQSPINFDYWLVYFYAQQHDAGAFTFQLILPKNIVPQLIAAKAYIGTTPLDQVKSELGKVTTDGKSPTLCQGRDGWTLIG